MPACIAIGPLRATPDDAMADFGALVCRGKWILAAATDAHWPSRFTGWHAAVLTRGARPCGWGAEVARLAAGRTR